MLSFSFTPQAKSLFLCSSLLFCIVTQLYCLPRTPQISPASTSAHTVLLCHKCSPHYPFLTEAAAPFEALVHVLPPPYGFLPCPSPIPKQNRLFPWCSALPCLWLHPMTFWCFVHGPLTLIVQRRAGEPGANESMATKLRTSMEIEGKENKGRRKMMDQIWS